jgi:hypothetical protein
MSRWPRTLADIFGTDVIFCGHAPVAAGREWLPRDPAVLDALTGEQVCCLGGLVAIVQRGTASREGLALLAEAGFSIPPALYLYGDDGEAIALTRRIAAGGRKVVLQHVHPPDDVGTGGLWIDPGLLAFLNDKANLAELVPGVHLPQRRVVARRDLVENPERTATRLPVVLKASSRRSSGAGVAVIFAREPGDVRRAAAYFASCDEVVVENLLAMERNFCVSAAVLPDGEAVLVGAADQECDGTGAYTGTWLGGESPPPEALELALTIARRAASLGYRGAVGIDMAVVAGGKVVAFDLNFRVNGSFAPLLIFEGRRAGWAATPRPRSRARAASRGGGASPRPRGPLASGSTRASSPRAPSTTRSRPASPACARGSPASSSARRGPRSASGSASSRSSASSDRRRYFRRRMTTSVRRPSSVNSMAATAPRRRRRSSPKGDPASGPAGWLGSRRVPWTGQRTRPVARSSA